MPLASEASLPTPLGDRYIGQLCAHFAHKNPTTREEGHGRVDFAFGTCLMSADAESLSLRAEAPTEEELLRLQDVISSHLQRFAWRDMPTVDWSRQA